MVAEHHRQPLIRNVARPGRAKGFTLVEVVVAFAVLAIAFGALYEILASSLHRVSEVERYERAVMYAQSLLAESTAAGTHQANAATGKDSDGMTWQRQIEPYDIGHTLQSEQKPFIVTVIVHWGPSESQTLRIQAITLGRSAT